MSEIDYSGLPESLRAGMRLYIEEHIQTGSFLRAVIENDRSGALAYADPLNAARLQEIFDWAAAHVPSHLRGADNRRKWIEGRRASLEGFAG